MVEQAADLEAHPRAGQPRAWIVALILCAAVPRVVCAVHRSLWLDEFHSLFHAEAASLGLFFEQLRLDNHPPAYFLLLRGWVAAFGTSELVLRVPGVLLGTWTAVVSWRLARGLPRTWAPVLAPLLVCFSSLQVLVSSEARMYPLLALAVAQLLVALRDACEGQRVVGRVLLWTAVGLHTHYFFLHYGALMGGAAAFLALRSPAARPGLRSALVGAALAAAVALPWYLLGFREQLGHGMMPGGTEVSFLRVLESLVHLQFVNLRIAGELPRALFLAAGALSIGLAAWTLWRARPAGESGPNPTVVLAAAVGFGVPFWAGIAAGLFARSGFTWNYLAGCTVPLAVLIAGHGPKSAAALVRVLLVLVPSAALTFLNAFSAGTENYRDAVAWILAEHREGDGLISIEPGPETFPNALGWKYYGPRLAGGRELPPLLEMRSRYRLNDVGDLADHERIRLLDRSVNKFDPTTLELLREHYHTEELQSFGWGLGVRTFSDP